MGSIDFMEKSIGLMIGQPHHPVVPSDDVACIEQVSILRSVPSDNVISDKYLTPTREMADDLLMKQGRN